MKKLGKKREFEKMTVNAYGSCSCYDPCMAVAASNCSAQTNFYYIANQAGNNITSAVQYGHWPPTH